MFHTILIANRGAVAARVLRAVHALGARAAVVHSDADADLPYLREADRSIPIGPGPARESYLDIGRILAAARAVGAEAIHPGYGFLSENPEFARAVQAAGMVFIGPNPDVMATMGHKTAARDAMARLGMPVGAGSGPLSADPHAAAAAAATIGYPVLVKPAAGGGGIGMIAAHAPAELTAAIARARSAALRGFGDGELYLERLIEHPRHVEVQLLGDRHGAVRHLFERDCSVQRRHQKVIEEAPAPGVPRTTIEPLANRIAEILARLGYDTLGTVEMLLTQDGSFQFLEMNTRLQVEHGVTEAITGLDLVVAQIRVAAGAPLADVLPAVIVPRGHAIEARVYAEDPKRFLPSPGRLDRFRPPAGAGLRVETGYAEGCRVTPFYDPLLAKVIAWDETRAGAIGRLADGLTGFEIAGLRHNIPALLATLRAPAFLVGAVHTGLLAEVVAG